MCRMQAQRSTTRSNISNTWGGYEACCFFYSSAKRGYHTFIRLKDFFNTAGSPLSPLKPSINRKQLIWTWTILKCGLFDPTGTTHDGKQNATSSYEASSIGPSSSLSAWLARISIRVRAKRPQSSACVADSWKDQDKKVRREKPS